MLDYVVLVIRDVTMCNFVHSYQPSEENAATVLQKDETTFSQTTVNFVRYLFEMARKTEMLYRHCFLSVHWNLQLVRSKIIKGNYIEWVISFCSMLETLIRLAKMYIQYRRTNRFDWSLVINLVQKQKMNINLRTVKKIMHTTSQRL